MNNIAQPGINLYLRYGLVIIALVFQILPINNLLSPKLRGGNLSVIEGGIELIAILILLFTINWKAKDNIAFWLSISLLAIYARLHQVLIPVAIGLIYLEGILQVGAIIRKPLINRTDLKLLGSMLDFISGIIGLGILFLALSIIGLGSASTLKGVGFLVIPIAFFINRKATFYTVELIKTIRSEQSVEITFLTYLGVLCLLFLASKTNNFVTFDGLNYGIRTEYTLFGNASMFEFLNMGSKTFYYPKLFELINIPLNILPDYSFVMIFTLLILALFCSSLVSMFRYLGINRLQSILLAFVATLLPAFTSISTSSKPDTICIVFTIWSVLLFYLFVIKQERQFFIFSLCSLLLSLSAKYLAVAHLPFIGVSFIVILFSFQKPGFARIKQLFVLDKSLLLLLGAFLICIAFVLRTYLLTGMPMMILSGLWTKLGFEPIYEDYIVNAVMPSGKHSNFFIANLFQISSENIGSIMTYMKDCFFSPRSLLFIGTYWYGNSILLFAMAFIFIILSKKIRPSLATWLCLIFAINFFQYIITFYFHHIKGYAGYYLIAPVILCLFFGILELQKNSLLDNRLMNTLLYIFLTGQIVLAFTTGPNRAAAGTKPWDYDLFKDVITTDDYKHDLFTQEGLIAFNKYVESTIGNKAIILNGYTKDVKHVNARVHQMSKAQLSLSYKKFKQYLQRMDPDIILVKISQTRNKNILKLKEEYNIHFDKGEKNNIRWLDTSEIDF